jgi:hypothetical protein
MNIRSKIFGNEGANDASPVLSAKRPQGAKSDLLHTIPVARQEHRRGNTRGGDRHRLSHGQVQIAHGGTLHEVELINLSGGGAMVSGAFSPMLWDRVDLHLAEDGVIECAVRWLKGERIGLEFAHETQLDCSPDEQAKLLRTAIHENFKDVELDPPSEPSGDADPADDNRAAARHPLIWSGTLHYDFTSIAARLRNISASGALVEVEVPLPVGAEPLLDLGAAGTVFATVTWVVGDQAGLRFHAQFDMTLLAQARPQIAPVKWQRPDYLTPGASADSPWAAEWQRMSVSELRDQLDGFIKR